MFKVKLRVCLLAVGVSFQNGYADDNANSALLKTQDCLRNQTCESINTDAGKAADLKALEAVSGNGGAKQALYNISADIMPILEKQAGGDALKMQEIMLKAQADPVEFLNSLPPDVQTKIKDIAFNKKP
jgi:hypothetical protein